jgi:hypothetical protein
VNDNTPKVYLSRRNLLALLSKLDRESNGEDTHCAILKNRGDKPEFQQTMKEIMVIAVADDEYYGTLGRPAGMMVDADEKNLPVPKTGVSGSIF